MKDLKDEQKNYMYVIDNINIAESMYKIDMEFCKRINNRLLKLMANDDETISKAYDWSNYTAMVGDPSKLPKISKEYVRAQD